MRVSTSISIPTEMKEKVDRFALATKRSSSAVVEMAVEEFLAREDVREILSRAFAFKGSTEGGELGIHT
jgi:predicted transcriptional regulator